MKHVRSVPVICLLLGMFFSLKAQVVKMPGNQTEIQKMATQTTVNRALVLPNAEKLKLVQATFKGNAALTKTKNYSLSLPVTLDTRNAFADGKAKLYFDFAAEVSAAENYVYFDQVANIQPRIRMFYNVASPGFYVFDFTVGNVNYDKPTDLNFQNLFIDTQTKTLSKGIQHQVFVEEFKTSGWQLLLMESKTGWKFYALEISQFK